MVAATSTTFIFAMMVVDFHDVCPCGGGTVFHSASGYLFSLFLAGSPCDALPPSYRSLISLPASPTAPPFHSVFSLRSSRLPRLYFHSFSTHRRVVKSSSKSRCTYILRAHDEYIGLSLKMCFAGSLGVCTKSVSVSLRLFCCLSVPVVP